MKVVSNGVPRRRNRVRRVFTGLLISIVILITSGLALGYYWYSNNIKALSNDETTIIVPIPVGSTTSEIAIALKTKRVIRSAAAFEVYVRINSLRDGLQAGTYELRASQDVGEIVGDITEGIISKDLVTILPAQRLDQLRAMFAEVGYSSTEIDIALRPETYVGHPALLTKPKEKNLEGYLYPDTYLKTAETPLTSIIKLSLDEFASYFTTSVIQSFEAQGLTPYEGLIISSIVEREVNDGQERRQVAQVFLKRFKEGMMLGSDPTALYGALIAGIEPSVFADTPYNTRLYTGLTPTPINNVSVDSLEAVGNPAESDFLYFVSGDDGVTRFSRTLTEHEALTARYCIVLCRSY
jgi:UPF0755 protein